MDQYDYIVVGAGSAGRGAGVATERGRAHRVLLVEAGRASHPYSRFPISFGLLIDNPAPTGATSPIPSPTPPTARSQCRAARCWAARAPSTVWSGCAGSRSTTTPGRRWARAAGAGRMWRRCSPASRATRRAAPTGAARRPAARHGGAGPEPALRRPVQGRRRRRLQAQPGLQQRGPGRRRQDPGQHLPRPAHERRALLSQAGDEATQPARRHRGADAPRPARRQALRRHRLRARGPRGRGARGPRGDLVRGRGGDAAAARAVRHRQARDPARRTASTSSTPCRPWARISATTSMRASSGA